MNKLGLYRHNTRSDLSYNSRGNRHGIAEIKTAVKRKLVIRGSKSARALLFEHVDNKTILAGHASAMTRISWGLYSQQSPIQQSSLRIQCSDPSKGPVGERGILALC